MKKIIALVWLLSASALAVAAGPDTVARSDRSLWPDAIDTPDSFDRASRAEILVFVAALAEESDLSGEPLKDRLHIKAADTASIEKVRDRLLKESLRNWKVASHNCPQDPFLCREINSTLQLVEYGKAIAADLPATYQPWYTHALIFHKRYADELIRLAALFPKVSSEIDVYSTREYNGSELPDRHFLLTFDDGPTNKDGNTDLLLPLLNHQGIHASFYMLGERLSARLQQNDAVSLEKEFQGQCTALHGWKHVSHAKSDDWEESVLRTRDLVKQSFPSEFQPWFRPPYGQRRSDSASFFAANGLFVALWNIDSQDWNAHMTGEDAAQRVMSLMLLWRHGVILFHDIHPKAQVAVPWLINHTHNTGVHWQDCRNYGAGA